MAVSEECSEKIKPEGVRYVKSHLGNQIFISISLLVKARLEKMVRKPSAHTQEDGDKNFTTGWVAGRSHCNIALSY